MKKAFSLIELSIVLLIIGIIVAGMTQGSRLIQQFRLNIARNLTENSPVASIKGLSLWYETSLESSFNEAETEDALLVSEWHDINPQASSRINATASGGQRPAFHENVFNHLPGIRFDGNAKSMNISHGNFMVNTNYTVFVVSQRRTALASYVLGGNTSNFYLGYSHANERIMAANSGVSVVYALPTYSVPVPTIITAALDTSDSLKLWINGVLDNLYGVYPDATAITAWSSPSIGVMNSYYFNGDVAEIIIFSRFLKTEERQEVEEYLSKKYNITVG